jgi:hypothetical protein
MISAIVAACIGLMSIVDWANDTIHAEKKISSLRAMAGIFTIGGATVLALSTTSYFPNKPLEPGERRIEFAVTTVTQDQVPVQIKGSTIVKIDPRVPHTEEAINAACATISNELANHMKTSAENEYYSALYNRCNAGEYRNWYNVLAQISAEHNSDLYQQAREIEKSGGDSEAAYDAIDKDRTPAMPPQLQTALSSVQATWNGWIRVTLEPTFQQ